MYSGDSQIFCEFKWEASEFFDFKKQPRRCPRNGNRGQDLQSATVHCMGRRKSRQCRKASSLVSPETSLEQICVCVVEGDPDGLPSRAPIFFLPDMNFSIYPEGTCHAVDYRIIQLRFAAILICRLAQKNSAFHSVRESRLGFIIWRRFC